jgi:hypothetical protein
LKYDNTGLPLNKAEVDAILKKKMATSTGAAATISQQFTGHSQISAT